VCKFARAPGFLNWFDSNGLFSIGSERPIRAREEASPSSKAGKYLWVTGNVFWQELQGDKSVQPGVFSLVNDAHPAAPQLFDDAVVRDGLADHGVRQC
jgi:hypothetical protein